MRAMRDLKAGQLRIFIYPTILLTSAALLADTRSIQVSEKTSPGKIKAITPASLQQKYHRPCEYPEWPMERKAEAQDRPKWLVVA